MNLDQFFHELLSDIFSASDDITLEAAQWRMACAFDVWITVSDCENHS